MNTAGDAGKKGSSVFGVQRHLKIECRTDPFFRRNTDRPFKAVGDRPADRQAKPAAENGF